MNPHPDFNATLLEFLQAHTQPLQDMDDPTYHCAVTSPEDTDALLAHLEMGRQTGCLTIASADGLVCRAYLLAGKVFHAEGPAGEGEPALMDALSWTGATTSFDEKAMLPDKQSIGSPRGSGASGAGALAARPGRFPLLSDDRRVTGAELAYIGAGCLFAVVIVVGLGVAVAAGAFHAQVDSVIGLIALLLFAAGFLWLVLYIRYRFVFRAEAVAIPGGLIKADIPRVVDAPAGVITGEPEVVVSLPARCLTGRLGKCRVEFYATGLQIWKGPQHPEPRWQFAYEDLLQAESVVLSSSGARNSQDQYSLRLIAARPRMAFLFGNAFTNRDTQLMLSELGKHHVRTFTED